VARQIGDARFNQRQDTAQGDTVVLDLRDETLIPLRLERRQIVRHVTGQ